MSCCGALALEHSVNPAFAHAQFSCGYNYRSGGSQLFVLTEEGQCLLIPDDGSPGTGSLPLAIRQRACKAAWGNIAAIRNFWRFVYTDSGVG